MKYAPIIIPTLCRVDTFIPCIDSLSRCVAADKTDVYVALDYPLKESHWDGYIKILNYIEQTKFPFKSFNLIFNKLFISIFSEIGNFNCFLFATRNN